MRPLAVISLFLLILLASCGDTPSYVIPPSRMAAIKADVYIGEAVVEDRYRDYTNDSLKRALLQSIYLRHGVTTQQVDTSLYWYGNHIGKYMEVCKEVEKILEQKIADAERAVGRSGSVRGTGTRVAFDGDSVNVWRGIKMKRNTAFTPSDYIPFSLRSDRNWERGDRYMLSAKGIGTRGPISLSIAVDYNDGSTEYVSGTRDGDGMLRILLVLDSAKVANNVYGSIHYFAAPGEVSYLDSILLVRTRGHNDNKTARVGQHIILNR